MKYLFFIIFSYALVSFAQNVNKIDSLENALKTNKSESSALEIKLQLAKANLNEDNDKAIALAKEAVLGFEKLQNKNKLGECYSTIGLANNYLSEYEESVTSFMLALKLFESEKNYKEINSVKKKLGTVYYNVAKYPLALKYFNEAKGYYEGVDEPIGLASIYNNIGLVFQNIQKFDSSLIYHQKSLMIKEKLNDKNGIANSKCNIGNIYLLKTEFKKAIPYYEEAIKIKRELQEYTGIINPLQNLGLCYFGLDNLVKAEFYINQAVEICKNTNKKDGLKDCYYKLSDIYSTSTDLKNDYNYYNLGDSIESEIFNVENNNQILELETKYQTEKKEKEIEVKTLEISNQDLDLKRKQLTIYAFIIVLVLIGVLAFFIYRGYKQKQKAYVIITKQKQIVEEKNKEITDSIAYAKRIQSALLTPSVTLDANLGIGQHFVYFKPKDIVSGDFYWSSEAINDQGHSLFYIACCDSTGHGVPGAFMSILNMGFLSEAIKEKNIYAPGEIFNYTRERLVNTVSKEGQQDGFDGIIFCFNITLNEISYAASNNSPVIIRNSELVDLKCDKMPVGKGMKNDNFTTYIYRKQNNDKLYLYTDGYADQFGGPKGKKFMYKKLNELLLSISSKSFSEQPKDINETLVSWQGDLEQVDDILIIGIQL
jgi:serine phosphatase RsbU (regulator of sigma subunit)